MHSSAVKLQWEWRSKAMYVWVHGNSFFSDQIRNQAEAVLSEGK